jgi:hypothetical protein
MIFVPIFADTWGSTFPKGSSLLKSLMICTAVLFFDGIAIFAFYAKLNPRLAGLLTCFLVLITGLLTWLLSRFSTEGYLKPTRPYAFSLFIFVLIGFSVLVLYILYAMFGQTIELTQGLGLLTALFAVITGLVGTYFGVKASSDASEGAQELAQSPGGNTTPPTISSVSPPNGAVDVDGNTDVTATFSTNMNPATITPDTLRLESLREANPILVPGAVRYDPPIRMATLTPNAKPLQPGLYQGTVTTDVRDQMGRALAQPYTWQFLLRSGASRRNTL